MASYDCLRFGLVVFAVAGGVDSDGVERFLFLVLPLWPLDFIQSGQYHGSASFSKAIPEGSFGGMHGGWNTWGHPSQQTTSPGLLQYLQK
jgi:hypothetical protein